MNFIKDRELALRFKNNAVPSKERFLYLLIFMVLSTLLTASFVVSAMYPQGPNQWDTYVDIAEMLFTIAGTIICYQTNKNGDDREFIERYISIGFPVLIQTTLISIGAVMVVGLISHGEISDQASADDLLITIIAMLYYYWRLNSSIKIAAN